jgi:hypothetical protein
MTSVSEDSLNIQIGAAGRSVEVLVRSRNDPSFYRPIVACGAHFRLTWAAAATEDHTPDNIKVATQSKFDFELSRIGVLTLAEAIVHISLSLRTAPS